MRLLAGEREGAADVLLPVFAHVAAGDRDAAPLRVEEAEQEVRDRGLAGAARPDERDARAGVEPEVEARERGPVAARVARRHALEHDRLPGPPAQEAARPDRAPPARGRSARARAGPPTSVAASSRAVPGSGCTDSNDASASSASVAISTRSSVPAEWAETAAASTPTTVSPVTSTARPSREPGDERVAPGEARQLGVGRPDRGELLLLAPVDDELGGAAQQLDELRGQLPARRGLTAPRGAAEPRRERRQRDPGDEQPGREDRAGQRQDDRRGDHARGRDDDRDERRPDPAEVEPLQRVDVADHAADEVAAPEVGELRRRERLDARVEARRGCGRARAARDRARRAGRGSARSGARSRRSGRATIVTVSASTGGCSAAREIR